RGTRCPGRQRARGAIVTLPPVRKDSGARPRLTGLPPARHADASSLAGRPARPEEFSCQVSSAGPSAGRSAVSTGESLQYGQRPLAGDGVGGWGAASTGSEALLPPCGPDAPAAVSYRVSWPDQQALRCTLSTLAQTAAEAHVRLTPLILVGPMLEPDRG